MYNKEILTKATFDALENRGVDFTELAKILYDIQHKYSPNLTVDDCLEHIMMVLRKREVQHAVLTGIAIDQLVEQKKFPQPIQEVIENDEGLYGIDEILALSITNIYGSIGLTNFGYLDKVKPGIIGEFDKKKEGQVHTFLDDILSAIVAAAASRLAHSKSE
jgi:phosphatidylglycerophosphatase A